MGKEKEQIEFAISERVGDILDVQMGEGSDHITTNINDEAILIRLKNALSLAERYVMKNPEGAKAIKELKEKIIENVKSQLENIIKELTNTKVTNIYSDINTKTGERIIVITVDENLEEKFKRR
ncbi:MAG: hypothetical protein AUJ85_09545 [Elusimicrobia bacterium CG1_02_37_114]|nr:MAG: hypothetical protein AUJ85_09545 [Elusimicrobia bacterium CG1_02_37_114]PIV52901.1 MAG: hypothetical protein COS17_06730 [Elusimicrobia bacterium CG02_land_8_20_14_3_00_37_13]PIZ12897.1 MAG: hypothetical protein COY53_07590 [Elusimicrobia bacterium CG_4_10_14_0_8_um_filter_37_32]